MLCEARNPSAATLAREALYICQPDGFLAHRCTEPLTDAELAQIKFERVTFKPVKVRPPICPINGAEGGDDPYWVRIPHNSKGQYLQYG